MRKLFGIIIVIAIILVFARALLGNREQSGDSPENRSARESAAYGVSDILLINDWNPLPDDFVIGKLVTLFEYKDRNFDLARSDIQLDKNVYDAADTMFAAMNQDGIDGVIISSGYRGREKQEELYNASSDGTVARPGHSEHETGLAFDVSVIGSFEGFDKTPQFEWLIKNCWDYGFILRYPKDKEDITGIVYEPWHYRYVGLPHSQAIRNQNITLEEYLEEYLEKS